MYRIYAYGLSFLASLPEADFDVTSLHSERRRQLNKSGGSAFGFMPDDGTGSVAVWRIEDFEMAPLEEEKYGMFFGGDSYVLKYTYEKEGIEHYIVYFWQVSPILLGFPIRPN